MNGTGRFFLILLTLFACTGMIAGIAGSLHTIPETGATPSIARAAFSPELVLPGEGTRSEDWIRIDPVQDHFFGDGFHITGRTSLPVGSRLRYETYRSYFCPGKGCPFIGPDGTVSVLPGLYGMNVFSIALHGSAFKPDDEFAIAVTASGTYARGMQIFRFRSL